MYKSVSSQWVIVSGVKDAAVVQGNLYLVSQRLLAMYRAGGGGGGY